MDEPVDRAKSLRQRIAQLRASIHRDADLTATDHRVSDVLLTNFVNTDPGNRRFGLMWPAAKTIAEKAQCGERSVFRSLHRLRSRGYLVEVAAGGGVARGTSRLRGQATTYGLGTILVRNPASEAPETLPIDARNPANPVLETLPTLSPNPLLVTLEEGRDARAKTIGFELEEEPTRTDPSRSTELDEWYPGPDLERWAAENVPSVADPLSPRRVERFKRWHRARGTTRFADCNEAYRSWLENEPVFDRDRRQREMLLPIGGGGVEAVQSDAEFERATNMRVWKETGVWRPHWGAPPDAGEEVA